MALAQMNPVVGDIEGNSAQVRSALSRANAEGAQVLVTPELVITGYPPEDLLLKKDFIAANRRALDAIATATRETVLVVGFVDLVGGDLLNAAAICQGGRVLAVYHKHLLPNYGVFDEHRYFQPGRGHTLLETPQGVIGFSVCEDAWSDRSPIVVQGRAGAQIVVVINASPWNKDKLSERTEMLADKAGQASASVVYLNTVGGQDELVFDGASFVMSTDGELVARLPQYEEHFAIVDVPLGDGSARQEPGVDRVRATLATVTETAVPLQLAPFLNGPEEMYRALALGLHDYVKKTGFENVVIGLSGGVDSSLTAAIAADALGPENVLGVLMPSMHTTDASLNDAFAVAGNLGIKTVEIGIAPLYEAYVQAMTTTFGPAKEGLAEENIQARIRGNLLMAISNRYGHLVLATGNKSEMACGYSTLYGDMAGGFAVLKDVLKTEVYALSRYRNRLGEIIPESVLTKAPSAELRPEQKDEDSLGPYAELDEILEAYIEHDADIEAIVASGHDGATVERVIALVDRAEYKRRQAPPGPKVTTKAFGRDRRLPITNRWASAGRHDLPARAVGESPRE
ncbi:NAD+ synthase [soil metagenome]